MKKAFAGFLALTLFLFLADVCAAVLRSGRINRYFRYERLDIRQDFPVFIGKSTSSGVICNVSGYIVNISGNDFKDIWFKIELTDTSGKVLWQDAISVDSLPSRTTSTENRSRFRKSIPCTESFRGVRFKFIGHSRSGCCVDRGGIDYCDGGVYKCEDGTHDRRQKCECGEKPF